MTGGSAISCLFWVIIHLSLCLVDPQPACWDNTISCFCVFHLQGQSRGKDGGQHQLSSGGLTEYHPRPMHSPPPLRRATLPLFTATYSAPNPTTPLLNTPAPTPPLFLDSLEGGSTLTHRDTQSLQTDTRSAQLTAHCDMNNRQLLYRHEHNGRQEDGGWASAGMSRDPVTVWYVGGSHSACSYDD